MSESYLCTWLTFIQGGFLGLHVKQWLQIDEVGQGEICDGGYNFICLSYSNCRVPIPQGKGYLTLEIKSNIHRKPAVERKDLFCECGRNHVSAFNGKWKKYTLAIIFSILKIIEYQPISKGTEKVKAPIFADKGLLWAGAWFGWIMVYKVFYRV